LEVQHIYIYYLIGSVFDLIPAKDKEKLNKAKEGKITENQSSGKTPSQYIQL